MDNSFIIGYENIKNDFGYFPTFHDDIIDKIEIFESEIIFIITMKTIPNNINIYPQVKITFFEVKSFNLEGQLYGLASIILDMKFIKKYNYIETELTSSLGTSGTIKSNKVQIDLQYWILKYLY